MPAALARTLWARTGVRDGDSERDLHASDLSFHAPHRPDLVVYPGSTEEVALVLALANEHRVPVTPFGVGTSLEGHIIPVHGGISLDLSRLDRILEIAPENLTATVQAGVTRLTLERAVGQHGLFFPVDPGADATLGGMAATNAAGTTTVRYGKTRANVLALEAVLADGRVIRTGTRAAKSSAGYDLTGLLVGSEGTLAVITEVTVRLHAIPEQAVALRISFPDIESACRTAAGVVAAGSGVTRVEFLDAWIVAAVNAYSETSFPEAPCLFVEASGSEELVLADLELVQAIATAEGATEIITERDPDARARLWKARHEAANATAAAFPGTKERATDVCVPLTELAGAAHFARAEIERLGLNAGNRRSRRRRQPPRRGAGRRLRDPALRGARPQHRRRRARPRRHVHRRARDRAREDRRARAGARRPDPADAGDQGELRPERDPQPRQGAAGCARRSRLDAVGVTLSPRVAYRLGVDIGGTFTDVVLLGDDGSVRTRKVLSTPDDYARGVVDGAVALLRECGVGGDEISGVVHASTVASNTILEGLGARTALITTEGFRDVLEMRRLRIPVLYDVQYESAAPLVPRRHRFEIEERLGPRGEVWRELNESQVEAVAHEIAAAEVDAVAISLIHSYANDAHERRVEEIVRSVVGDGVYVTRSSEILPEIREYERTSTAVVNAYVGPAIGALHRDARRAASRAAGSRRRSR